MMATRRINAATTWLIRAFAPGCPTMLRSWASKPAADGCEQLTIVYDLPGEEACRRARALVKSAKSLFHTAVGRTSIRELTAELHEDHKTMTVTALLVKDRVTFAGPSNPTGAGDA